jgi:nitronate monooxygenase
MDVRTDFVARLRLHRPLIQAPMAGGATTPEFVAAVSNAGIRITRMVIPQSYSVADSHTANQDAYPATPFAVN